MSPASAGESKHNSSFCNFLHSIYNLFNNWVVW